MKKPQNSYQKNKHPFHQFAGFESFNAQWDETDPIRAQFVQERLPETLQKWNTVLLLAEQFAKVACERTGQPFEDRNPEAELSQLWPSGEWRSMERLLDALRSGNSDLSSPETEDCGKAALQLTVMARRCWTFRETIVQALKTNFELEREIFTLKAQVRAFEKMKCAGMPEPSGIILPGAIFQNDLNVKWSWLRENAGIVMDEPVGHYFYAVTRLLETPVTFSNLDTTFGDLIPNSRESLADRYELDEFSQHNIQQELYRKGLCLGLSPEKVFARCYYCYFANMPLSSLPVSTRAYNALTRQKINSIGDLLLWEEESLLRIPFMGKTSIYELETMLKAMGFTFNIQEEDFRLLYCF